MQTMAREFQGTFVADNHGNDPNVHASYEYIPDVLEEEQRISQSDRLHRFVPVEDIPAAEQAEAVPFFPKLPKGMTVEQALSIVLAKSPLYAVAVYEKATQEGRFEILGLLPGIVKRLVTTSSYTQWLFEETSNGSFSCLRILKGHARQEAYRQNHGDARERGVAIGMVAALGVRIA